MAENSAKVIKYGGNTIGVGAGNAISYVMLEFLSWKYDWVPDDPAVFVVMVGTLLGVFFLELRKIGKGLKYIFDRVFPVRYDHEHQDHHNDS